jgi:hypothetical protein
MARFEAAAPWRRARTASVCVVAYVSTCNPTVEVAVSWAGIDPTRRTRLGHHDGGLWHITAAPIAAAARVSHPNTIDAVGCQLASLSKTRLKAAAGKYEVRAAGGGGL